MLAKELGVQHKNLLRTIYKYTDEADYNFAALNFELTDFIDKNGDSRPMFNLSIAAALMLNIVVPYDDIYFATYCHGMRELVTHAAVEK